MGSLAVKLVTREWDKVHTLRAHFARRYCRVPTKILKITLAVGFNKRPELVVRFWKDIRRINAFQLWKLRTPELHDELPLLLGQRALKSTQRPVDLS